MGKGFVITRPRHDIATSYLHDFCRQIIKEVKETKDIHVSDLEGSMAVRDVLEKTIKKENPGLIFLNGHGNSKGVAGHNNDVILDENNIDLTKNKIVYALACDSLEELGKISINRGTKAYIGYRAKFMIVCDPSRESTPQKDKNVLPFRNACNTMINSLVFGKKVCEAIKTTKEEYKHYIKLYGTSEDNPYGDTPLIRFALAWNLEFLDMDGNPDASF